MTKLHLPLAHLIIIPFLLSFFCVSQSRAETSTHHPSIRVSAIGKISTGLSKGMRYRVRLTSEVCTRLDEAPTDQNQIRLTIRSLLRKARRKFISQLRTWEITPESNQLAVATLSNDARCYRHSSTMFSLSNILQEDLPFENPIYLVRTTVLPSGSTNPLTLRDIFSTEQFDLALKRISTFVTAELHKQLLLDGEEVAVINWIARGTPALEHSFDKFVLTRDGMRVFFDVYQVAAYAHGVLEVLIPWSILEPMLSPALRPPAVAEEN